MDFDNIDPIDLANYLRMTQEQSDSTPRPISRPIINPFGSVTFSKDQPSIDIIPSDLVDPEEALVGAISSGEKNGKFRLNCKKLFLTYPQNNTTREYVAQQIVKMFGDNILGYWIGRERHKNGEWHLHVGILLNDKVNIIGANTLDKLADKHGKYFSMTSPQKCLTYCTKTDTEAILWGTAIEMKKNLAPKTLNFLLELEKGASLNDLRKNPEFKPMFFNKRKNIFEYQYDHQQMLKKESRKEWILLDMEWQFPTFSDKVIASWLNDNLFKKRVIKQRHLWIQCPTNYGKSVLVTWLKQFCVTYHVPLGEDFYDFYDDNHDLIVIEEYKKSNCKPATWLNEFAQGTDMNIRKKTTQRMKEVNVPIILLSNYRPEQIYKKMFEKDSVGRDAFLQRWMVISPTQRLCISEDHQEYCTKLFVGTRTNTDDLYDEYLRQQATFGYHAAAAPLPADSETRRQVIINGQVINTNCNDEDFAREIETRFPPILVEPLSDDDSE